MVELALAEHVNEEDVKAGRPAECWPSQNTLAKMAGCKRSTVQRALRALMELGRISDTGRRQKRGVVVYRLLMTDFGSGGEDLTIMSDDRTSVLGKPFREVSTMSTKTTTKLEKVLAYGDIASAYRIVRSDRPDRRGDTASLR